MDTPRIVGRTALLSEVAAALDRAGAVITLVGDAGVGKTTLWAELLARQTAAWTWTGRCLQVEAGLGLAVLTDLFAVCPNPSRTACRRFSVPPWMSCSAARWSTVTEGWVWRARSDRRRRG